MAVIRSLLAVVLAYTAWRGLQRAGWTWGVSSFHPRTVGSCDGCPGGSGAGSEKRAGEACGGMLCAVVNMLTWRMSSCPSRLALSPSTMASVVAGEMLMLLAAAATAGWAAVRGSQEALMGKVERWSWGLAGLAMAWLLVQDVAMYNNHEYLYALLAVVFALGGDSEMAAEAEALAIAALCATVYGWAGLIKATTPEWREEVLAAQLIMSPDVLVPLRTVLVPSVAVTAGVAWGGLLLDLVWAPGLAVLFMASRWSEPAAKVLSCGRWAGWTVASLPIVGFHVVNKLTLPIGEFPLTMVILHAVQLAPRPPRPLQLGERLRGRAAVLVALLVVVNVVAGIQQSRADFWRREETRFGWMMMMRATSRPYLELGWEDVETGQRWRHDPVAREWTTLRQARKMAFDPAILRAYAVYAEAEMAARSGRRVRLVVLESWAGVNGSPLQRFYSHRGRPVLKVPRDDFVSQAISAYDNSESRGMMLGALRAAMLRQAGKPVFVALEAGDGPRVVRFSVDWAGEDWSSGADVLQACGRDGVAWIGGARVGSGECVALAMELPLELWAESKSALHDWV
ncbi:uncharacterized protein AMSG_09144 [Thecamonas trahens ATCC 50062]|uniref:Uncharacterized protein n=1 Tax=Thecamonas trahens ATCC 50062 TaxID=461836 RepID=A0A0L0DKX6_THETB|nr:hypothetical protein AMSG_09144 [Thecamonas trahens ATCC 50062]KNC52972.1 hypothetical protein AMSG_09144 [Thecamonas trahens ATCC 50062]|eukprot:XP_013754863.1 hypothetical protein AMSG_09144 [Thecamonas trahens ATCC 50062]